MKCDERDTCYDCECFLDTTLNLDKFCDDGKYPLGCPLLDGKVIKFCFHNGNLIIKKETFQDEKD